MAGGGEARWTAPPAAAAIAAAISALFAFSASLYWRSSSARFASRVRDLEASLKDALDKAASERRGRTRAQKALRESLLKLESAREADEDALSPPTSSSSYPMVPIGVVHSCFTTRNGTPRQPLVVPLARARLILNPNRAPPDALEGFAEYSHCWVLYIFHLNTDLEKLWKPSCRSKFKAKVRVPRLKGGKMGVLATRSPHRPCPIGLTVAKVIGLYVGIATVGIFIIWYTHGSFMGIDLSVDGHTLVTYSQLSNWDKCSTWEGFKASPFTAGNNVISFHSDPCEYFKAGKVKATTLSLSVLVAIEMFNSLNALSEDGSLLTMPPWVNPWLLLAMSTSFALHFLILYIPFLAEIFGIVPLSFNEWLLVLVVALPVILIDEVLKFIGRCKNEASLRRRLEKRKVD